jgi:gas vesicle protein GvpG
VFLIDDLLALPIGGFKFVLRTLQQVAEEQYTDTAPGKRRLLELQLALESGEISEQEYVRQEAQVLRELREIENRKRTMVGAEPEEAPALPQLEIQSALGHESSRQSATASQAKKGEKARRAFASHRRCGPR